MHACRKDTIDLFPSHCEACAKPLPEVPDPNAMRFQIAEVLPVEPYTTEYRRHAVRCSCGQTTCAVHDQQPASPFGPRLMALVALLTGVYHLSRRKAAELLGDMAGVRVSLGALSTVKARVSTAVQPAVEVGWDRVRDAHVKHTDGTSWFQSGLSRAVRTIGTTAATVFKIIADGRKQTLEPLYGALSGDLGQRPRQNPQLVGDGTPSDLLGTFSAQVRVLCRARRACGLPRP